MDLARLRRLNLFGVLQALRGSAEPVTLTELAALTGLSRASVDDLTGELTGQGWAVEVSPAPGSVGRPARRYRFRAEIGHVLGIDIGAHTVLVSLADLGGTVLTSARRPVPPGIGRADRLKAVDDVVDRCLADAGVDTSQIWVIAIGTTGVVGPDGEVTVAWAAADWTGVPLAEHLRDRCMGAVLVDNDTRLAALAEQHLGAARSAQDVIYLHAGLHTSAALIVAGRVHRGSGGAAGEIGTFPVIPWATAAERLAQCPVIPPDMPVRDAAAHVLSAAREGDTTAMKAVNRYANDLALGLAAMILTVDPELVVLGGGLVHSADVLLPRLRDHLEPLCLRLPDLSPSPLGDDRVALGAIRRAIDHVETTYLAHNTRPSPRT
ncbi:ROK family transcriptional regulator [Streptomyces sp. NPDC006283]|uniref:ROK family transcriptional regulator n=1 Tax=Streptomyces sp. NPDC006283 TaxID=3156741 RepID=UPI0033ADCDAB